MRRRKRDVLKRFFRRLTFHRSSKSSTKSKTSSKTKLKRMSTDTGTTDRGIGNPDSRNDSTVHLNHIDLHEAEIQAKRERLERRERRRSRYFASCDDNSSEYFPKQYGGSWTVAREPLPSWEEVHFLVGAWGKAGRMRLEISGNLAMRRTGSRAWWEARAARARTKFWHFADCPLLQPWPGRCADELACCGC
ncbi:hypothetical protein DOTSEDRAFT_73176 [Dothistroma septosporum NZE10]|uniref:Uncharacterized protein n=1 Tax=Dothistroma septosporum (strain NZE10 / CBS 128990) TaxID=675120 RepID=N1PI36_DOTSN|nr:hypothetical protein DOTSEDRAFT_73176 [Dothistroma septosporum NZE10]